MSITGVSITKSCSFRGVAQEFGNTYYYQTPLGVSEGTADALIDAVVAKERALHGTSVTFVRAKAWSAGGTQAQNQMLKQKPLSGTGSASQASASLNLDKERAFLVRFRAGVDSKGRPAYLRKWWHLDVGGIGANGITGSNIIQTATLSTAFRDALATEANGFKSITANAQNFDLVSEKGRAIDGATQAHQYIEHHQLGDMWRG